MEFKKSFRLEERKFAAAMVKMGQLEVLTGNTGEIRANSRYFHNVFVLLKKENPPATALWLLPLFSAADMVQESKRLCKLSSEWGIKDTISSYYKIVGIMVSSKKLTQLCVTFWVAVLFCRSVQSHLQVGFYRNSCGRAESIVRGAVRDALRQDRGVAAGLVRLHFHDCFVRGCEGSVLLDSTSSNKAEKDSPANYPSLRGFEVIDDAKARLEAECKGVVSCADILAFAARDSFDLTGGFDYDVQAGRRDGVVSLASETCSNLPPPTFNVDQLTRRFSEKGFTQEEMVTLSGAHTIGNSHCRSFTYRLYNFSGTNSQDPSLDSNYAASLRKSCPQDSTDPNLEVPMDSRTPTIIDVNYYKDILANRGLFSSDQILLTNPATASEVKSNARSPSGWKKKFAAAMVKMGQIEVLTGNKGEIRANCRVINS
ncbi:hypothetical protein NC651_027855 [Populus alba x Populus x berolinensis]|nr:hypothetical protein NC651_027855 [Populus alba x Populus x berolinensis]